MKISAFFIALTLLIVFNVAQSTLLRGQESHITSFSCHEGEKACYGKCCNENQKCCQNLWIGGYGCYSKSIDFCLQ